MLGNGLQIILLGGAFIAVGLAVWRNASLRKKVLRRNPLREAQEEIKTRTNASVFREMEVRLYDYGRDVEGRVNTTMLLLDTLINNAEDEIDRLESLLEKKNAAASASSVDNAPASLSLFSNSGLDKDVLTQAQCNRIPQLREAGLSNDEIARCLEVATELIHDLSSNQNSRDDDSGNSFRRDVA